MTRIDYVYKICTKQEWDSLKQKKSWDGSKSDIEDGFIHLSNKEQVNQTLKKYYVGQKNLYLLVNIPGDDDSFEPYNDHSYDLQRIQINN